MISFNSYHNQATILPEGVLVVSQELDHGGLYAGLPIRAVPPYPRYHRYPDWTRLFGGSMYLQQPSQHSHRHRYMQFMQINFLQLFPREFICVSVVLGG